MSKTDWSTIELAPLGPGGKRDTSWLQELLDITWDTYFSDVPQANDVRMVYGRRTKRRLGSISLDPKDPTTSIITMNGLFVNQEIPEFVILATLVHELTHYAHGFNSPLTQSQAHPHAGGVIRREYADRGLLELYLQQKRWLRANWPTIVAREFGGRTRIVAPRPATRPATSTKLPKHWWLGS